MSVTISGEYYVSPTDEKPATEPAVTKEATAAAPPTKAHEPRSFLATFLLTMVAGPLGLRHFYLGDHKLGWIRTGLFLGGYLLVLALSVTGQAALASLGFLAVSTAGIWALVDFFYVYNAVKTDADGQPLASTARDRKWAKVFYWAAIIGFIASLVLSVVAVSLIQNELKKGNWNPQQMQELENDQDFDVDEYLRELEEQSQNDTQLN